ncbi:nucleoporin subcomplex protein binding to Pom34-domain-containing protein [Sporodiniella umbellata]|nr:nucleoporin subcomplex protein binding to Pom34-domain-containing protein [Sporodiniella umbellata]
MVESDLSDSLYGTNRKLFETLEKKVEHCSTAKIKSMVLKKYNQMKLGLDAFAANSSLSRSKLNSPSPISVNGKPIMFDQEEKELVIKISDIVKLDELNCLDIWDAFRNHHRQWMDRNLKSNILLTQNMELIMKVIQFYFEERIFLLKCIGSLQRISFEEEHPFNSNANEIVNKLYEDKSDSKFFVNRLLAQCSHNSRSDVPVCIHMVPGWAAIWSTQNLMEQKALLEIMFLLTITAPLPPKFIFTIVQEFEVNNFGTLHTFGYALDNEGEKLLKQVFSISSLISISIIAIPSLTLDSKLDIASINSNLIDTPEVIAKTNQIVLHMGSKPEHAPFLLSWSYFIACLRNAVESSPSISSKYDEVKLLLEGKQTVSSTVLLENPFNHCGSMGLCGRKPDIQQSRYVERTLIGRALKLRVFDSINDIMKCDLCNENDANNYYFRSVLRSILKSFLSTTLPQFLPMESYFSLVDCYCILHKEQPDLCQSFWKSESNKESEHALISTALGRFPVFFTNFTEILSSLCYTSELDTRPRGKPVDRVYEYLCAMPTITVILKNKQYTSSVTENNVIVIQASQPIHITLGLEKVGGITIPEHTSGILLSNDANEEIVQFSYAYSGWHMFVSILANFVNKNQLNGAGLFNESYILDESKTETVIKILEVMHSVLTNGPKLVPELVNHIQAISSVPGVVYEAPIFVSVLCDILNSCCKKQSCDTSVLSLTVKCLTVLLPHYRQHIWSYLVSSPIIPHVFFNKPNAAPVSIAPDGQLQIQEIVCSFERVTGRYSLLLSFLDLVHSMIRDIHSNWWIKQIDTSTYSLNSEVLVKTLQACLHYIMLDVFPSFPSWRYKLFSERYSIGIKLLSIFIEICNYFKKSSVLGSLRDGVFENFLFKCGPYHISPLLDIVSDGASVATNMYKSGQIKDAQKAEELTALALVFIKTLLQRRAEQNNENPNHPESRFEHLIFDYNTHRSSSNFIFHVAKHVNYQYNTVLSIQATQVLTLLCRTTSVWRPAPSFIQYFGNTKEVYAIIQTYIQLSRDDAQSEVLMSSVWQFITSLLETQPDLAALFLDYNDFIMSGHSSHYHPQKAPESAIQAAMNMLNKWEALSKEKPTVISNILRFISTFWKYSPSRRSLVDHTRDQNTLWTVLEEILEAPLIDTSTSESNLENINFVEANFSKLDCYDSDVRKICCANLNKALAMRIVAYEAHLTTISHKKENYNSKAVDSYSRGLKSILSKIGKPEKLSQLSVELSKNIFSPRLSEQAYMSATSLLGIAGVSDVSFLLLKEKPIGYGEDGIPEDISKYGDSYLFNLRLGVNRIFPLINNLKGEHNFEVSIDDRANIADTKNLSNSFLKSILQTNHNFSIADSQIVLLQSFKTFVEACSHNTSFFALQNNSTFSNSIDLLNFICSLIQQLEDIDRYDGVTLVSYSILIQMTRNLIEEYIDISKPVLMGQDVLAKEEYTSNVTRILACLNKLLDRENYALVQSINDSTAIQFHRPLLEALMLCIYTIRGTITHTSEKPTIFKSLKKCLESILPVVCISFQVLTIKAQSFSSEGSSAGEEDIESCIKDITVATSLLQEIISDRYGLEKKLWIAEFDKAHVFESLQNLYFWGTEFMLREIKSQTSCSENLISLSITPYAETALYFLLVLSSIPEAAESLLRCNFFDSLANSSLTALLQQGSLDLFVRFGNKDSQEPTHVERNPLHFVWCQTLNVIGNLLRSTANPQVIAKDVVNILQVFGPQIGRAFERANSRSDSLFALVPLESLSAPLLEELEYINGVFYEIAKHLNCIPNIATCLLTSYKDASLILLQRYLYFYTHPAHMKAHLYRTDNSETVDQSLRKTLKSTLTIANYMVTTLIILSSADFILTTPDVEWPFGNAIIHPDMRASTDTIASFGTLADLINACITMVDQWKDLQTQPLQPALNVIQSCTLLLTSQTALWIAKPDITDDLRMRIAADNVMDVAEVLSKVVLTLEELAAKKIVTDIRPRAKLMYMLQTFLNNRFFES